MISRAKIIRTIAFCAGILVGILYFITGFSGPQRLVIGEAVTVALAWGLIACGSVWLAYGLLKRIAKARQHP